MMLSQFKGLDEMEQIEAIWNKGIHLAYRNDEEYKYELIQIDKFYVELKHHKLHDVLKGFDTFTVLPDQYKGKISIATSGE
jgi:hypothetical protein